jgi:hypothetical protein
MKVLGIVLLTVGILSLIGGLVSPSDADTSVIVIGYILKIGFIIGGIALILKKKSSKEEPSLNQSNEVEKNESNTSTDTLKVEEDKNNSLLKEVDLQEVELQKLKLHNLLTEEEFNIKREIVLKRKEAIVQELDKIKLEQELEKVKSLVNDQIKPQLLLLENTFKSELLTQEEFDTKKNQLFNEKYNSIFMLPYLNPDFQLNFEVKDKDRLAMVDIMDIDSILQKLKIGEIILYNKRKREFNKYLSDKFLELNTSKDTSEYSYVNIPNFLNRIGYPQLQKKFNNKSI